jgi:tetratricopeptide (TPR) repeat protein
MPSAQHDDPIRSHATDSEQTPASTANPPGVRTRSVVSARLALIALGALLLLAALVFFGLPAWLSAPPVSVEQGPGETAEGSAQRPAYDPQLSVRERLQAEEAVAGYLDARDALERQGVALWGAEGLAAAEQIADQAEDALAERDYPQGTTLYRQATDRLTRLADGVETVYTEALARGTAAIEAETASEAIAAFEIAVAIRPDSAEASRGLARAKGLESVIGAMAAGEAKERNGDLEAARAAFAEAAAMDPDYGPASTALARVQASIEQARFDALMSTGLEQLSRSAWQAAEDSLAEALRLRPGDPGAADGLAQAREGMLRQRISRLQDKARSLEAAERWQEALGIYDELLGIDPGLDIARSGQARSTRLAKLHAQIDYFLDDPDRLYSVRTREQANAVLATARETEPRGPRLSKAIAGLQEVLVRASTPRLVRLTSDGATEITIYRVGHLGSFHERSIALSPGKYTVVGSRPGYRDVRRELSVSPDAPAPTLHIACEEPV